MIGVFDSGLGGLSVLAALVDALPAADFLYCADSAHVPYGNRDDAYVQRRVLAVGAELASRQASLLVVACNTATAAAVQALRAAHPHIPVIGVEPGIKPAAQSSATRRIAVLVTDSTAKSPRLRHLIEQHATGVEVHIEACPNWATHVEQLDLGDPALAAEAGEKLSRLLALDIDRIVLGCTHYSFLEPMLLPLLGNRARLVDVAHAVAAQTRRLAGRAAHGSGSLRLLATSRPERLHAALPMLGLGRLEPRLAGRAEQVSAG